MLRALVASGQLPFTARFRGGGIPSRGGRRRTALRCSERAVGTWSPCRDFWASVGGLDNAGRGEALEKPTTTRGPDAGALRKHHHVVVAVTVREHIHHRPCHPGAALVACGRIETARPELGFATCTARQRRLTSISSMQRLRTSSPLEDPPV